MAGHGSAENQIEAYMYFFSFLYFLSFVVSIAKTKTLYDVHRCNS